MTYTYTPQEMLDAAEELERGAEFLDHVGWCRGTLVDERGRVCILGSLGGSFAEYFLVEEIKTKYTPPKGRRTVSWFNDEIAKRRRDCTSLMRRVARKLRKQAQTA